MRKRRHTQRQTKPIAPRRLDAPVAMFAYIQDSLDWRVWRGRTLSLRKAQEMIAAGEAQAVTRKTDNGIVTFYRETKPSRAGSPSPCTLTLSTMLAVARRGEELTPAEARQVSKFLMWPLEHDRRNAATVVAGSLGDLQHAEAELERAQRVPKAKQERGAVRAEFYPEPVAA